MWRWLSIPTILLFSLCFFQPCYAIPTSSGQNTEEEAQVLWNSGKAALSESRFQDAVNALQRYVDRYPGTPDYLRAHFYLGKALIEQNSNSKAVAVLTNFITSCQNPVESAEGRLLLANAYLNLEKYQQAYLITLEIDQIEKKTSLPSDTLLEALYIKSRSLLNLNYLDRATQVLASADKQLSDKNSPMVKGQVFDLKLKLKISECAQLPSKDRLDEGQLRDQLDRRGTCVLESLLIFHKILKSNDLRSAASAATQVNEAFDQYSKSCSSSYSAPAVSPISKQSSSRRTAQEMRRYHAELSDQLKQDCKKNWNTGLQLLNSWKADLPNSMLGSLLQTSKSLEKIISRVP